MALTVSRPLLLLPPLCLPLPVDAPDADAAAVDEEGVVEVVASAFTVLTAGEAAA